MEDTINYMTERAARIKTLRAATASLSGGIIRVSLVWQIQPEINRVIHAFPDLATLHPVEWYGIEVTVIRIHVPFFRTPNQIHANESIQSRTTYYLYY